MLSFELWFSSEIYSGVGLLDLHGSFTFSFFRNLLQNVFQSGCTNLPSHQQCREFPSLQTLSRIYCLHSFDNGHSDQHEVIPHCTSDLHVSISGLIGLSGSCSKQQLFQQYLEEKTGSLMGNSRGLRGLDNYFRNPGQ